MRIEAADLVLRTPEAVDVPWIHAACQDPEIARWTRIPAPYEPHHAVEFVDHAAASTAAGTDMPLVIEVADTGELLGATGLHHLDGRSAELGYWLAAEARGRGVARRAVSALVAWADAHGIELLYALVLLGNDASERVLADCGFECVSRDSACSQRDGEHPASRWERRMTR